MTKLYEANNHLLIHTNRLMPAAHSHMAAHIILSQEGKMRVCAGETEYLCHGVMIPSNVSHTVDNNGKAVLVFMYDSTTNVSQAIQQVQTIPKESCSRIAALYSRMDDEHYDRFEKAVLNQLGIHESLCRVTDERIQTAMSFIRSACSEKITCQKAASAIHLSQGRFSHLFRKQTGMTFASYLIYQRLMRVYAGMIQGKSITEAALDGGFSSSSHFADVNRRVFGTTASCITQDLVFIKTE